jgi:hypothetical protein
MANNEAETSKNYVMFIDVLYAVVVGETIFTYGKELFNSLSISTFALFVTYVSIISSFMFWHKAISKFHHKRPYRFFVDIVVLVTYLGIVFNHANIDALFYGFIVLYSLYLLWDFLTRLEYGKQASRLTTSAINLVIVIVILGFRLFLIYKQIPSITIDITSLAVLLVFIVASQIKDILHVSKAKSTHQPKSNTFTEQLNQPKR